MILEIEGTPPTGQNVYGCQQPLCRGGSFLCLQSVELCFRRISHCKQKTPIDNPLSLGSLAARRGFWVPEGILRLPQATSDLTLSSENCQTKRIVKFTESVIPSQRAKGLETVVSKPYFEIAGQAGVEVKCKRGSKEVKKRQVLAIQMLQTTP